MKLLVCVTEYYPIRAGVANAVYNVVSQLKKMGVDCTVCSPIGPDIKLGSNPIIRKYARGRLRILYYWHQVSKYFKEKANDYDMVWLNNPLFRNNPFSRNLIAMHVTSYGSYKYAQKNRSSLHIQIYYKIAAKIEKYCLNRMDLSKSLFISPVLSINNELETIGIPTQKIVNIPYGVDTNLFKPLNAKKMREKIGLNNNPTIVFVGRLSRAKLADAVIKTMPLVLDEVPDAKLVIVGGGEEKENLIRLSKRLKVYDSIIMCGSKPNEKLPMFYSMADVIVCPFSGLVLLEALSMGKPVVAFNFGYLSEQIKNMQNGILVEFLNIENMAKEIIKLLEYKELSNKLGKNAREYAINNLSWEIVAKKYLKEFKNMCGSQK